MMMMMMLFKCFDTEFFEEVFVTNVFSGLSGKSHGRGKQGRERQLRVRERERKKKAGG